MSTVLKFEIQLTLQLIVIACTCFNCRAVELQAPSSRLLLVSIPHQSHLNALITIARAIPAHHHVAFAVFDVHVQALKEKLEPYRPVSIVQLGPLANEKRSFQPFDDESNVAFMGRAVFPILLSDYQLMHDSLLAHLSMFTYDMMIVNVFAFAAQDLAHDLKIPMIIHSHIAIVSLFELPAWVPRDPDYITQKQLQQSFFMRFYNHIVLACRMIYHYGPHIIHLNRLRRAANRSVSYTMFGLSTLMQRSQGHPILISSPLALEFRHAYTPNYHFIGFLLPDQTTDKAKLTEESYTVDAWLNETKAPDEFVVLAAFGTISSLHEQIWQALINTVLLVPNMRLLLTISERDKRSQVNNLLDSINKNSIRVLVVSWIRQQHVLNHPSVRLFIMHGGLNSIGEAVYAHVPVLILPGFSDQHTNAAKVEEFKIGRALERNKVTASQLALYIKEMYAEHEQYVQRLIRLHQLNELEGGGAQRAATLIDIWLLVGYKHLDTLQHQLPFLVALSLDTQLTFVIMLFLIGYLVIRCILFIGCNLSRNLRKKKKE